MFSLFIVTNFEYNYGIKTNINEKRAYQSQEVRKERKLQASYFNLDMPDNSVEAHSAILDS